MRLLVPWDGTGMGMGTGWTAWQALFRARALEVARALRAEIGHIVTSTVCP